jgi:hypothetical protein
MLMNSMSRCLNTLHACHMDMWNTPLALGGLSLRLGITSSLRLKSTPKYPTSSPDLLWCNSIRMDPYAHPQHIKVLKHFEYI